jgi:2-polyprenyl-3-methyl-5-hydroxy-6-metoxy-1,4-benzoquinol methylase
LPLKDTTDLPASATSAVKAKRHFLQPAWEEGRPWGAGSLRDRFESVRPYLEGGSLLDIGCASRYGREDWIHGLLAREGCELVGIDIDEPKLDKIRAEGFDVRFADGCNFDLGQRFDVVFAGEVIEHLDDVKGFLSSVRRHLTTGGRLVLTTPNAFYVANFVYRLGGNGQVHPEHTCWYCEDTLRRVLEVNGYMSVELSYIGHTSPTASRRLAAGLSRLVLPSKLALDTIVAVARVEPDRG